MFLRLFGAIVLLLVLAEPGLAEPISIDIVQTTTSTSTENLAVGYLIKLIEERSGGRIQCLQPPKVSKKEGLALLEGHSDQLLLLDSAGLIQKLPLLQLFELPFLYADRRHLHNILDSEVGQQILQTLNQQGLKPLSYWDTSFLQLASSSPLLVPQQAEGKIFKRQTSMLTVAVQGEISPGTTGEHVYEISLAALADAQFEDLVTDLTMTNHSATGSLLFTNSIFWNRLPDDLKVIVKGAIQDTTVYARELMVQADQKALHKLEVEGRFHLHQLSAEQRSAWQKALMQSYRRHFSKKELQIIEVILKS